VVPGVLESGVPGAVVSGGVTGLGSGSGDGEQAARVPAMMMLDNNLIEFMGVLLGVVACDGEWWLVLTAFDFGMSASCDSQCPASSVTSRLRDVYRPAGLFSWVFLRLKLEVWVVVENLHGCVLALVRCTLKCRLPMGRF
jgi:hypothetical protein